MIGTLADKISERWSHRPLRVGIDGITAAGKTVLADELVAPLEQRGFHVIRASLDGFHHPAELRHRRGAHCPVGYVEDSFDRDAVRSCLLDPLGPEGTRKFCRTIYDFRAEDGAVSEWENAPEKSVLLFEGVMLFYGVLQEGWDFRMYVSIDFDTCLERALVRDLDLFGSEEALRRKHEARFHPGQKFYLNEVCPEQNVDVVVDNRQPDQPVIRCPLEQKSL